MFSPICTPAFFNLKKAGGRIGQNVVEIAIKMNTSVRKPLMIKKKTTTLSRRLIYQHSDTSANKWQITVTHRNNTDKFASEKYEKFPLLSWKTYI